MRTLTGHAPPRQTIAACLRGTWGDRLLLLLALLAIAALWLAIQARIGTGPVVAAIYHGDTLIATYPLPQPGEPAVHLQVEGDLGTSEIVIDAHGARIAASPCASQRCVLSGAHSHVGDIIACVPNRILVTLRGSDSRAFDAIVE